LFYLKVAKFSLTSATNKQKKALMFYLLESKANNFFKAYQGGSGKGK